MDAIGHVVGVLGAVSAEQAGATRVLQLGGDIYADDVLLTGSGAHLEIRFKDQSVLSQGENARLTVDEFVYTPQDSQASNMVLKMAEGTFRMVTGEIAAQNPEGVQMVSPLATIGIRGTGADMQVGPEGIKVGIFQYDGKDLTVTTPLGTVIINNANLILDVFADGSFGELRSYSDFEKAFFDAVAPILSVPTEREPGDAGDDGDQGADDGGDEGEVTVEVRPAEGVSGDEVLNALVGALEELAGGDTLAGGAGEDTLGTDLGELSDNLNEFLTQLYAAYEAWTEQQQTQGAEQEDEDNDTVPAATPPETGGQDDGGDSGSNSSDCHCPAVDELDGTSGYTITGLANETWGADIASAGDVNGDGYDDILIAAANADPVSLNEGKAYLLFGGTNLATMDEADGTTDGVISVAQIDGSNGYVIEGYQYDGKLTTYGRNKNMSTAEDFNNDGFDDIVMGANGFTTATGEAYMLFGGSSLAALDALDGSPNGTLNVKYLDASNGGDGSNGYILNGFSTYDQGGTANSHGDINGDGYSDAIHTGFMAGATLDSGEVYVIFGGDGYTGGAEILQNNVNGVNGVFFYTSSSREFMGSSVTGVPDMNGDGYDELLIGANQGHGSHPTKIGNAYLVFGGQYGIKGASSAVTNGFNVGGLDGSNGYKFVGVNNYDATGVVSYADVTGDGVPDLLIGAPQNWSGQEGAGLVFVVYGDQLAALDAADGSANGQILLSTLLASNGADGTYGYCVEGGGSTDQIGQSVQFAGDVNNDGYEDFLIGAHEVGANQDGESYLIFGGANGVQGWDAKQANLNPHDLGGENGLIIPGKAAGASGGYSVSNMGDVNNDGYDDFGVTGHDIGATGEVYLIFGNEFSGYSDSTLLTLDGNSPAVLTIRGQDNTDEVVINLPADSVSMNSGTANSVDVSDVKDVDGDCYLGAITLTADTTNDILETGSGDDYVNAGAGNDEVTTGEGNDELWGGLGTDVLKGGDGNDILCGGEGADQLYGGSGADTFLYEAVSEMGQDYIDDGVWTEDKLQFKSGGFGNLATGTLDSSRFYSVASYAYEDIHQDGAVFILETNSGQLYYDEDGDDAQGATSFVGLGGSTDFGHEDIEIIA